MNCAKEARRLADYITSLEGRLTTFESSSYLVYDHVGALFVDVILQAGLNYTFVVKPRVQLLLSMYPNARSRTLFQELIDQFGLATLINWKDQVKLNRIESLLAHAEVNGLDTCSDLKVYLSNPSNRSELLEIKGIGPKTVDYLLKLLGYDTVAVDRHIYSFIEMAEIEVKGYHSTKKIVEYAADFLEIRRADLDYSIWSYMSTKNTDLAAVDTPQLSFQF